MRFGEALRIVQEKLDSRNFYAFNPAFDRPVVLPASNGCSACAPGAQVQSACPCQAQGPSLAAAQGQSACPNQTLRASLQGTRCTVNRRR